METLYLLIPLSALLVLGVLGLFAWALHGGQFDDLEREGERIVAASPLPVDVDQPSHPVRTEEFHPAA
ncbi:MAG TPA: cbb3-type cytochrome oxidase assembly protein CcoS [Burkholderiaceae bacterium]